MTYKSEEESAIEEMPSWIKMMRTLVFGLLMVSIIAMFTLVWAAYKIVTKPAPQIVPAQIELPEGAQVHSFTLLGDGGAIIVYGDENLIAERFDNNGQSLSKAVLE